MNELERAKQEVLKLERNFLNVLNNGHNLQNPDIQEIVGNICHILQSYNESLARNFISLHNTMLGSITDNLENNETMFENFSQELYKLLNVIENIKHNKEQPFCKLPEKAEGLVLDKLENDRKNLTATCRFWRQAGLEKEILSSSTFNLGWVWARVIMIGKKENMDLRETLAKDGLYPPKKVVNLQGFFGKKESDAYYGYQIVSGKGIRVTASYGLSLPLQRTQTYPRIYGNAHILVVDLVDLSKDEKTINDLKEALNHIYSCRIPKENIFVVCVLNSEEQQRVCYKQSLKDFARNEDITYEELKSMDPRNAKELFQKVLTTALQKRPEQTWRRHFPDPGLEDLPENILPDVDLR